MDSLSIADVIEDLDVLGRSSVKSVLSSTSPETGRHDRCNRNAIADKDARVDAQLLSNAGECLCEHVGVYCTALTSPFAQVHWIRQCRREHAVIFGRAPYGACREERTEFWLTYLTR
eukprot:TRINITY_DN920_c0_g1_i1.p1 TRINITY_DN920_c0_g1~~TRINITY_DN920_c0_g1_i1.p1  ORF type:complete len:117 (-),score=4.61 TRINITY_DN920_c0_g1_i1:339-689(-)